MKNGRYSSFSFLYAEVAQLVERNLAKVEVAGSSLVFRSHKDSTGKSNKQTGGIFYLSLSLYSSVTGVAEQVDAQDLKSCFPQRKYGFDPRPRYTFSSERSEVAFTQGDFLFYPPFVMFNKPIKRCAFITLLISQHHFRIHRNILQPDKGDF